MSIFDVYTSRYASTLFIFEMSINYFSQTNHNLMFGYHKREKIILPFLQLS